MRNKWLSIPVTLRLLFSSFAFLPLLISSAQNELITVAPTPIIARPLGCLRINVPAHGAIAAVAPFQNPDASLLDSIRAQLKDGELLRIWDAGKQQ